MILKIERVLICLIILKSLLYIGSKVVIIIKTHVIKTISVFPPKT